MGILDTEAIYFKKNPKAENHLASVINIVMWLSEIPIHSILHKTIGAELDRRGNSLSQPSPNLFPSHLIWDDTCSPKYHMLEEQSLQLGLDNGPAPTSFHRQ